MLVIYQGQPGCKKVCMDTHCCSVNWYSLLCSAIWEYLSNLNMYIPLDPGNPLPGISHRKIFAHAGKDVSIKKDISRLQTSMLIYVNKNIWNNRLLVVDNTVEVLKTRLRREFTFSLVTYVCITWNFIMNKTIK